MEALMEEMNMKPGYIEVIVKTSTDNKLMTIGVITEAGLVDTVNITSTRV